MKYRLIFKQWNEDRYNEAKSRQSDFIETKSDWVEVPSTHRIPTTGAWGVELEEPSRTVRFDSISSTFATAFPVDCGAKTTVWGVTIGCDRSAHSNTVHHRFNSGDGKHILSWKD